MRVNRDSMIKGCIFFALFCILTCALKTMDVEAIGPEGSKVGFAALNGLFRDMFPYDKGSSFRNISNVLVLGGFGVVLFLGFWALLQMIKKRTVFKIERFFWVSGFLYILMFGIYLFFDNVIVVNTRPVLIDGILSPSYPSSHVLAGFVCYFSGAIVARKYNRFTLSGLLKLAGVLVCVFRCICGIHWFTDIVGSIMISLSLLNFYEALVCPEGRGGKAG